MSKKAIDNNVTLFSSGGFMVKLFKLLYEPYKLTQVMNILMQIHLLHPITEHVIFDYFNM